MARFPVDDTKIPDIGRALARAVSDPDAKAEMLSDPRAYLIAAGIDENALKGYDLKVVEDTPSLLHFIIPAEIDQARVDAGDEAYLTELGEFIALACTN